MCTLIAPPLPPRSSVPPQSKGKGKHRLGTSSSAVPAKCSAQGEGSEDEEKEEDEEEVAGSSAKRRRREESHMTGEGFSKQQLVSLVYQAATCVSTRTYYVMPLAHLIMVYTNCARSALTG